MEQTMSDLFKRGDRVEYVGNTVDRFMRERHVGRTGEVYSDQQEYSPNVQVLFDDEVQVNGILDVNLRKLSESEKGETQQDVMKRYVSELNSIFVSGTFVPHY